MRVALVLALASSVLLATFTTALPSPEALLDPHPEPNGVKALRRVSFTNQLTTRALPNNEAYLPPRTDPFYLRPDNISLYKPGEVIRFRVINPNYKVANAGRTTQILYRTTNTQGHPSATVTTAIEPANGSPPRMMLYNIWEDSTNRDCAPSYTILLGNQAPNIMVLGDDVPVWFAFLLSKGITVVVTDYEGPKSALFAGFQAGYAILDAGRAVTNYMNWPADAKIAMTGYSEGAHVTCWAANLSPSYAPELNIVGAMHGGTPIDMELTLRHFDNTSFSGFALGGMHGMMAAYPQFNRTITAHAQPKVLQDLATIYKPPVCHAILRSAEFAGIPYMEMLNLPSGDPYQDPTVRYVLDRETMWNNKSSVGVGYPKFPRMIYQGRHDDVINFQAVQDYVNQQCSHGADIQFNIYEANAHTAPQLVIGGDLNAMLTVLQVFELDGQRWNKGPCGAPSPTLLNLVTLGIDDLLGGNILAMFGTLWQQGENVLHTIGF